MARKSGAMKLDSCRAGHVYDTWRTSGTIRDRRRSSRARVASASCWAGSTLADSEFALRVLETSHPPAIYVPPQHVNGLVPSASALDLVRVQGHRALPRRRDRRARHRLDLPRPVARLRGAERTTSPSIPGRVDGAWLDDELRARAGRRLLRRLDHRRHRRAVQGGAGHAGVVDQGACSSPRSSSRSTSRPTSARTRTSSSSRARRGSATTTATAAGDGRRLDRGPHAGHRQRRARGRLGAAADRRRRRRLQPAPARPRPGLRRRPAGARRGRARPAARASASCSTSSPTARSSTPPTRSSPTTRSETGEWSEIVKIYSDEEDDDAGRPSAQRLHRPSR